MSTMPDQRTAITLRSPPVTMKRIDEAQSRRNLAAVHLVHAQLVRVRLRQLRAGWTTRVS